MTKYKKLLLPIVIVLVCAVIVWYVTSNPPKAKRSSPKNAAQIVVEVAQVKQQAYQVILTSFGTVQARTQSMLVAQVGGQIIKVSEQFRDGGFFEKGEALIWLDDRDYQAEVKIAEANVLTAQQGLMEEQAQSEQALRNWQRLGNGDEPSLLVLRKPQLEAAKATLLSAEAQLQKSNLALERTVVKAPYAGRILSTQADLGQVVSNNSQIASVYAIDIVEVRLPINNNDLELINLPREYKGNQVVGTNSQVYLRSDLIANQHWLAKIVRTEGAIDNATQQLYMVAQIDDPFSHDSEQNMPVKIGQYVDAEIVAKQLPNAIVIPNSAIYQGSYVYTVNDNLLQRKDISIRWQNSQEAVIAEGLKESELLVLTPMGQVSSGTRVQILDAPVNEKRRDIGSQKSRRSGKKPKGAEAQKQ